MAIEIEIATSDFPHLNMFGVCAYECALRGYGEPCGEFCKANLSRRKEMGGELCMVPTAKCVPPGRYQLIRSELLTVEKVARSMATAYLRGWFRVKQELDHAVNEEWENFENDAIAILRGLGVEGGEWPAT